jgi:DNA-directed RNA polymerase specialized sigma24 family protein
MLSEYESFARKLSYQYPFFGSGADERDVYQVGMITAWEILDREPTVDPRFVYRRMRLRVLDFVRERNRGQSNFERQSFARIDGRQGIDTTLARVLVKDELNRLVEAVRGLSERKRYYLVGHLNGVDRNMMGKKQTVDVMIMRARKQLESEIWEER